MAIIFISESNVCQFERENITRDNRIIKHTLMHICMVGCWFIENPMSIDFWEQG